MKLTVLVMAAVSFMLLGCSKMAPSAGPEQLKRDLVGQEFFYQYNWGQGGYKWRVQEGQVKDLVIDKRLTDSAAGTEEVHALTTLNDGQKTIRGVLAFHYKKFEQGWSLRSVEARDGGPGKSFAFEILSGVK